MSNTTTSTSTELGDDRFTDNPTSINDVVWDTATEVVSEFNSIERFEASIRINGCDEMLLVGRSPQANSKEYRLHHWPETGQGLAGTIKYNYMLGRDDPNDEIVAFCPADEASIQKVTDLEVVPHDRTEQLNNVINRVRTELTDTDWMEDGRADTGYGEWVSASKTLADLINGQDKGYLFPPNTIMRPKVTHALFRYPLASTEIMSAVSDCIRDQVDGGFDTANPEALRSILIDYGESLKQEQHE